MLAISFRDFFSLTGLCLVLSQLTMSGQMLIDGYDPLTNDRFANDSSFIAAAYDLSGLARSSSNKWGSVVSQNVFLSSAHFHPAIGNTLTFYETNDPLGPSITRTVIGGQPVPASDVWVGILDQSLPPQYSPFPFLDEPVSNSTQFNNSSIAEAEVFMVGRSNGSGGSVTNIALGRNRIENWNQSFTDTLTGVTDSAIETIKHISSDAEWVPFESRLVIFDSSAPVLLDVGGSLVIVGLNWYAGTDLDIDPRPNREELRDFSGFAYVGNYAAEIQGVVDAFQVDATTGYLTWAQTAFGGLTDLAQTGPSLDSDADGLDNFSEYVFVLDPLSPASLTPAMVQPVDDGGSSYIEITFLAREDPDLQYALRVGSNLLAWNSVSLDFSGGSWSSEDPSAFSVNSQTDLGSGVWQLVLRLSDPLASGMPQLLSLSATTVP
ncbi:hypothetical protein G0Q06_12445 [Puniceicoccales bacterium CK1056]|uniref:Uncharacterized protein n=1 Tax=Oceanipulchritudo coccoides TaxID=2706888 RepID=A0A6B2M564_9BACT|nr:hypothetical protein [Oceanipulchritudo coccoides]NDV63267.1 hypothetical protein [Oceanipulchritudo coccoides]